MKPKYFFLLLVLIFPNSWAGNSVYEKENIVKFFEGTWQDAMKKSIEEKKYIFLYLTATWCGNCKKMEQGTFTDKKVAEYFNKQFINVQLDGEKGEGQRLARKYGLSGYPSVYLIDKNENPLISSEGYHPPDDLIKLIQSAVPKK